MNIYPLTANNLHCSKPHFNKQMQLNFGSVNNKNESTIKFTDDKTLQISIQNASDSKQYLIYPDGSAIIKANNTTKKIKKGFVHFYQGVLSNKNNLSQAQNIIIRQLDKTLEEIEDKEKSYFDKQGNRDYSKKVETDFLSLGHNNTNSIKFMRDDTLRITAQDKRNPESVWHDIKPDGSGIVNQTHWSEGRKVEEGTLSNIYRAVQSCSKEECKNYAIQEAIIDLLNQTLKESDNT